MLKLLASFRKRTEGQVTIIFALATVPLLLAAGAAIDRIRVDNVHTEMQAAVDGAALAAAMADKRTNKQREELAAQYFAENFAYGAANGVKVVIQVTPKKVIARSSFKYTNSFMSLAGLSTSEIKVMAEVMRSGSSPAEIALVLDYSGSMKTNNKYQRMAKAASEMVASLDDATEDGLLKFGLVPFSAMVHTSMPASYVTQASATSIWTGCTQDRTYPHNTNVDTPTNNTATKWGYITPGDENTGIYACATYKTNNLAIMPLTTDTKAVKDKLASMLPVGNTNIPLGAEFGWNLLDPALPYDEAKPYSETTTRKFLILLTDGVQTSKQSGADGTRSKQNGKDNLVEICKGMKDAGITVYTIAYDITDPDVTALLQTCAGDRYYEPDVTNGDINKVFASISDDIKTEMIRIAR